MTRVIHPAPRVSPAPQEKEDGYAIALVALLLIPLIGFMALAIDVGAWYTQATKVQRAVDASALSSVVWMPDTAQARVVAEETMSKHGIDFTETFIDENGIAQTRWDPPIIESVNGNEFQVRVVLTDNNAPVFFGKLFVENVSITRQAIAEFVKPVPLGSRSNTFGNNLPNGCDNVNAACNTNGAQVGFWAAINGPREPHTSGDPFSTVCLDQNSRPCTNTDNDGVELRRDGYLFAIEIPQNAVGQTVTLELKGPAHVRGGNLSGTIGDGLNNATPMNTRFAIYEADGSLLTTPTTSLLSNCFEAHAGEIVYPGSVNTTHDTNWTTFCTFVPTVADIYPLQVQSSGFPGAIDNSSGSNSFSIRATSALGDDPSVYAIRDMGIMSNQGASRFEFAEIVEQHAGKILQVSLFDPGDSNDAGTYSLRFLGPSNSLVPDCEYRTWSTGQPKPTTFTDGKEGGAAFCNIITRSAGVSNFNDQWLEVRILIPTPGAYNCAPDCWWSIDYDIPGTAAPTDRTTWSVAVLGDPVRIVG